MSVGDYWDPYLARAGYPRWNFWYWISEDDESRAWLCGLVGDPDVYRGAAPASYCLRNDEVYLSSSWLFNHTSNNGTTPYGLANTIAHEIGHAVQAERGWLRPGPVKSQELQANCLAGAWVGDQARKRLANRKDVSDAQRDVQSSGDYEYGSPQHHGTADQRVHAWQTELSGGPSACRR